MTYKRRTQITLADFHEKYLGPVFFEIIQRKGDEKDSRDEILGPSESIELDHSQVAY